MHDPLVPDLPINGDRESLARSLETIIERTYDLEKEYKLLQKSMVGFQDLVRQVIESQPSAMWIVDKCDKMHIFFQNSASRRLDDLLARIDPQRSGQEIELEGRIFLIHISDVGGEEEKQIIMATDITEQKRSERLASMGQIAAHLAHEIRNPIGSISLLASILSGAVDARQKPLVEEIQSAIARVERIIKSTLLFTRGIGIARERFPIARLREEIEENFESYPFTKAIDLEIAFDDTEITGDPDLLGIVLQNFLYNAIDAIEEDGEADGRIRFTLDKAGEEIVITITDSGVPIENEQILYEPFKTTKTKGHGLGLALSLEIIKAHNGRIALLKEPKGFQIYLPML